MQYNAMTKQKQDQEQPEPMQKPQDLPQNLCLHINPKVSSSQANEEFVTRFCETLKYPKINPIAVNPPLTMLSCNFST
jgi:hypothetical protein